MDGNWRCRHFFGLLAVCLVTGPAVVTPTPAAEDARKPFNVLFLAVDDLRPALGCYGDRTAVTPHINRLAERSLLFQRAYCQQAVCSPSRLSLLTGRRPDTIRVWDLATHFRDAQPAVTTLPQYFRQHGYHTRSLGKIFHGSGQPSQDAPSWSVPPQFDTTRDPRLRYALPQNLAGKGLKRSATEAAAVPDRTYVDGLVCAAGLQALTELQARHQPFFLAVGFRKPHLPFCAPQKYWDLYARKNIPLPTGNRHPLHAPEFAVRSWRELEGYTDIPADGRLTIEKTQELRHGYYACVSYIDALVGRLLTQLDQLELTDNTVIVLWGDHGFHLGEQGLWTKANNYELSTRVPLILAVPGQTTGLRTAALTELVDIYPTLADICGLPAPTGVEGVSLKPLLTRPERTWKQAAFSQYPRARTGHRHRSHGDIMGYAARTDHFRYVEWREWNSGDILARELYDHRTDPGEMQNLAAHPGHDQSLRQMAQILAAGWKSVQPVE
ncbi:MAG: sulfatase [Planctomycetaceae bacterium]